MAVSNRSRKGDNMAAKAPKSYPTKSKKQDKKMVKSYSTKKKGN